MKILLFPLVAIALLAYSCTGRNADITQVAANAVDNEDAYQRAMTAMTEAIGNLPAMSTQSDSLSYYLGFFEGLSYKSQLRTISPDQRERVTPDDYRMGIYAAIAADSTSTSFAEGVKAASGCASYLDYLESRGAKINRRRLVATILQALDNPSADSVVIEKADSISNAILLRYLK